MGHADSKGRHVPIEKGPHTLSPPPERFRIVNRYIELMSSLLQLRRLPVWHGNIGKRLIKSPKIFLRDSGVLHSLLGIHDMDQILSHPVVGASWEGFVIENILSTLHAGGAQVEAFFYRTAGGAELDLLLCLPGGARYAFEIKRSLSPQPGRGFWSACEDVRPQHAYIVYPGTEPYPISREVTALPAEHLKQDVLMQIISGTPPGTR